MKWDSAPVDLQLDVNFIDVWRSRVDLPETEIRKYAKTLSQQEQERAEGFSFADKYEEYVVTRGLLRKALAHMLKQTPEAFEFEYTASKKPYLSRKYANKVISFNASHSHGQALVAVSVGRNIGIDIERIRAGVKYEKLAQRFFSEAEYTALMQCPPEQRLSAFYAIWTRKEAFVKAVGKGIAFGLSEFDVNVDPHQPPVMLATRWDPKDASKWLMATIKTEAGYMATVVTDGPEFQLRLWQ